MAVPCLHGRSGRSEQRHNQRVYPPGVPQSTPQTVLGSAVGGLPSSSISGLVVEYIVAINVTRVRFSADALFQGVVRLRPRGTEHNHPPPQAQQQLWGKILFTYGCS